MYNYIKGEVVEINANTLTIESHGIGYDINASADCLNSVKIGDSVKIYTFLKISEDSHTLYGFLNIPERALFMQLLNVSGVGAKSAIAMLSIGAKELLSAISKEDVFAISTVKGVSKKTAEKVILELRGKLPSATSSEIDDAVSALVNLGLSRSAALSAISTIDTKGLSAEKIVSLALKSRRQ